MRKLANVTTILFLLIFATWCSAAIKGDAFLEQAASTKSSSSTHDEQSINTQDHVWHWRHSDNGIGLEVKIRGHVEFADDYSDITQISDGGSIVVIDERSGMTRKFEAKATGGGIQRTYSVNGATRQFDREASTWLAKVLDDTVRQGGYDAKPRVQRILKRSGPTGVLQEISRLKGDYVKRIYFDELIENGNLDDQQVRQVLHQAAAEIKSDYEKAQLLIKIAEGYTLDDSTRTAYLEAVSNMKSDYEKGRALSALVKNGEPATATLLLAVKGAANINSDYEKAQFLIKVAGSGSNDEAVRSAVVSAARSIHSDYERGRVLSAVIK